MNEENLKALNTWLEGKQLPKNLQSEMDYYLNEVERDYTVTLAQGVNEWHDRHEQDKKAGWLNLKDVQFIREAFVQTGIAKRVDRFESWQCNLSPTQRTWFKVKGVAYEYTSVTED